MMLPKMNSSPPIVGVPCLLACQLGPKSTLMGCPNFSLCSHGNNAFPPRAATTNASSPTNMLIQNGMICVLLLLKNHIDTIL